MPEYTDDEIKRIDSLGINFNNFYNLPEEYSAYENSRFVVFTVPYEKTTSYRRGTAGGPQAIIHASHQIELHDVEIGSEPFRAGIHTDPDFLLHLTDPEKISSQPFAETHKALVSKIKKTLTDGKIPVVIGGEHTISIIPIEAAATLYPDLTVVQFDAHADLRSGYEGNPYSHACFMRRVLESTHPPRKVIQLSVRSICPEEMRFARDSGKITVFMAKDISTGSVTTEQILKHITGKVYITIDMDTFDPSEVPAVGTPEPGGLRWNHVADTLAAVADTAEIIGFDVVELAPLQDSVASQFLAAKLIYRIMGLIADRHQALGKMRNAEC